jgi:hypothetical protein
MAKKAVVKLPETEEEWIKLCLSNFESTRLTDPASLSEPTWTLWPGMKVEVGNLVEPEVVATAHDGKVIVIKCLDKGEKYGRPFDDGIKYGAWPWTDVIPLDTREDTTMIGRSWMWPFSNQHVGSALSSIQRWGYIDNPDYQRGYVWTEEDRVALMDNIAAGYPIGSFIFKHHKWPENRTEIIDGKQRINAILDFMEGRWSWRGKFWYQLSYMDRHNFEDRAVAVCTLPENASRADCLKMFLACNAAGVAQTQEHIAHVEALYKAELEKQA